MSADSWKRIEEIFQAALDLAPGARAAFLDGACAGDAALREQVGALVAQFERAGESAEQMPPPPGRDDSLLFAGLNEPESDQMIGRRVGAYRLVREVGRGGMGAVYLAERADSEFRRRVAVKLIKRGMDTDFILKRFRNERQILASLNHPNIARLLDGGTTEDGLPYFVMEYIEGQPLYVYCDARTLPLRERLRLFAQVCAAVHYAHQNLVIHRDIKPSNILVTAAGVPKLLDFGIAKLLNPELAADTSPMTATAMRLMTPEYASPEQVQGLTVSPASDIYSLGVLLYELLTGHRPYRLRHRTPHEIARVVCEEEPERPSDAVVSAEDILTGAGGPPTLEHLARARGAALERLRRELAGDLDNIALKALRKETRRRYHTAEELREDIGRHLEGRPVSAPVYFPQARRARRPSAAEAPAGEKTLAVLPLKLLSLSAEEDTGERYLGVGLADALITRLSNVRRFAVRPTSAVQRYADVDGDPLAAGQELGVEFVLDGRIRRAGDRIRVTVQLLDVSEGASVWAGQFDAKFTDVLSLEDAISKQVAEALVPRLTGDERAQLAKRGTTHPEALEAYMRGRYYWNTLTEEGFAKAIASYDRAIALDPSYAAAHAAVAEYHLWLAIFGVAPPAECVAAARAAAQRAVELDDSLAEGHAALGFALLGHELRWESAKEHYRRAIGINPNYPTAHVWYGCQLAMEGRFDEADAELRRAVELDPLNPLVAYNRQWCLYHARRYEESVRLGRELIRTEPHYAPAYFTLSWALRRLGAHEEAAEAARKAVELGGRDTPQLLAALGAADAEAGRREEARRVLSELNGLAATRFVTPYHRALIHVRLGELDAALKLLEESFEAGEPWVVWFGVEPQLDPLRADPRFAELLRRTKNPLAPPPVETEARADERSVAVLPFKLLAPPDSDDAYLGVGLADALITRLSSVRSLVVRPTSSVLRFGSAADPTGAGRALGVGFVLDGRIIKSGGRIRVTVQLLDVSEGASVWAGQFDENVSDVLSLEDAISRRVAEALLPHLTGDERAAQLAKRGTDNPEAFEAYIRGRYHWNTFTEEGLAQALLSYQRAITLAPDYALAYAGLADYYNWLGVYSVLPFSDAAAAAKEAALKAVEIDDNLAEGYAALGFAALMRDFDWKASASHLSRAVELNPNYVTGRVWYCYLLGMSGRFDEAFEQVSRALEIDPLTPIVPQTLCWVYYHARRKDEAVAATRGLAAREPNYGLTQVFLSMVLWDAGEFGESIAAGRRAVELLGRTPYTLCWLAAAHAAAGRAEEARALLAEIETMSARRYVSPYLLAMVHCKLGDGERAFGELERALAIRDGRLAWLGVDPQFDPLRSDPRYAEILRRTDNPALACLGVGSGATTDAVESAKTAPTSSSQDTGEAQQLYAAGRYFAAKRTAEGLRQAIERFERAVERDPRFAACWAELADCYALLNWYVEPPPADAFERALRAARKATEADPSLAEAHASLAFIKSHYERDWAGADAEFRRAIELNPDSATSRRWYAFSLSAMGRHDEALAQALRAQELSPRSGVMATAVANVLYHARRYDEAVAQCRRALEIDPGSVAAHVVLRWSYEMKGQLEEALAIYEEEKAFAGDTPTTRAKYAHVLATSGRRAEARDIVRALNERRGEQWVTAYEIAVVHALLGDADEAFDWLAQAQREHAVGLSYAGVDPHLDSLRPDPRFRQLLRSLGLSN